MKNLMNLTGVQTINKQQQHSIYGGRKVQIIGHPTITTSIYKSNHGEARDKSDDAYA